MILFFFNWGVLKKRKYICLPISRHTACLCIGKLLLWHFYENITFDQGSLLMPSLTLVRYATLTTITFFKGLNIFVNLYLKIEFPFVM
jgi:hypothetical protein